MNMVNYEDTPLYVVYEMIRSLAERYGTYIIDDLADRKADPRQEP